MSQIIISNLDDRTMQSLKQIAWQKGLSFQESLRCLLRDTATAEPPSRAETTSTFFANRRKRIRRLLFSHLPLAGRSILRAREQYRVGG
jgi:hypothetical protein